MATKKHPAHHTPVEHRSHHAAKAKAEAVAVDETVEAPAEPEIPAATNVNDFQDVLTDVWEQGATGRDTPAEPILGEVPADVVELPGAVIVAPPEPVDVEPIMGEPVDFDVVGSLKNFSQEVAKIMETLPPNLPPAPVEPSPPAETTIADHFDCACGPERNLSMEAGVYRCHSCGTTHHAQTLEGRKAAGK